MGVEGVVASIVDVEDVVVDDAGLEDVVGEQVDVEDAVVNDVCRSSGR